MRTLGLIMIFWCCLTNPEPKPNFIIQETRKVEIAGGLAELVLPVDLRALSDQEIVLESPIEKRRPSAIFENRFRHYKLAVNYGASAATDKDLLQLSSYMEKSYKRLPNCTFVANELKVVNHKQFAVLKFELAPNPSGGRFFNFLFMTTLKGELCMLNYSFPVGDSSTQIKAAEKILNSMVIK